MIETNFLLSYLRSFSAQSPVRGELYFSYYYPIPLGKAATATVGPTSVPDGGITTEVSTEVTAEVKLDSMKLKGLLDFCIVPCTRKEMQDFCEIKTEKYFREKIIKPMLTEGLLKRTIPDKPNSRNQKYIRA